MQLLRIVKKWFGTEKNQIADLYKLFGVSFVSDTLWSNREEDLSRWPEQKAVEEGTFISKFALAILDSMEKIKLK